MIKWRIYYSDGSVFDNSMGAPEDAPGRDIQVIGEADESVGWTTQTKADFYVFDVPFFGGWMGVDHFGLFDYLSRPGLKIVKFGRMLTHAEYSSVLQRALNDPDAHRKSAWRDGEPGTDL